ncbi:ribosomal large subunit pseudouridine synthase D [Neolewinella agarilytica]|uniref:Ribosomal large subunit pseudouridine synthase D n=2 Tax=Neolewinella agarilytica TaxID=478744 RepID=A0A1H9MWE0_9BACT|nr:ribosomal large subunit pseudouridine synthase D [Neolewinella agarilytica]
MLTFVPSRAVVKSKIENQESRIKNPFPMHLQVLFEDNHLIAVNKPAGLLSQGDETGDRTVMDWVKAYIKHRYNKPGDVFLGSIHRLDRPVSGVIIFARTSKALKRMTELFRDRKVTKTYWAITTEQPDPIEGSLKGYIYKDTSKNRSKIVPKADSNRHKGAKMAKLDYRLLGRVGTNILLEVKPETGRPHQIRVQLADQLKTPIHGDLKYGSRLRNQDGNINLHARKLEFQHPVTKEAVKIEAPIPEIDQLWQLFAEMTEW